MPRIPQHILDSVIYLYRTEEHARTGMNIGGTGFLLAEPYGAGDLAHIYLVTNRHVVKSGGLFMRINLANRLDCEIIKTELHNWVVHPDLDDVAVCRLHLPFQLFAAKCIHTEHFLTKDDVVNGKIGPGDDIFMAGRFVYHDGRESNLPSVRFGNISMMPLEPIETDSGLKLDGFLVEMRSISGFSGSPVFLYEPAINIERVPGGNELTIKWNGPWFIGLDWGHIPNWESVREKDAPHVPASQGWVVKGNTGAACVCPSWKLRELLDIDELVLDRKRVEHVAIGRMANGAVSDMGE